MYIHNLQQIKVCRCSKRTKSSQTLILNDLNSNDTVSQVKEIIQQIVKRFNLTGFKINLIYNNPVEFQFISPSADDYYRFIIQFSDDMNEIQNGLITSINNCFGAVVH